MYRECIPRLPPAAAVPLSLDVDPDWSRPAIFPTQPSLATLVWGVNHENCHGQGQGSLFPAMIMVTCDTMGYYTENVG